MRSTIRLVLGCATVFTAHVALPFAYISVANKHLLPAWLAWPAEAIDPAIWMILLPFALACVGYNFVLSNGGLPRLAHSRLLRWPIASAAAFFSQLVEMYWIFNTYGS